MCLLDKMKNLFLYLIIEPFPGENISLLKKKQFNIIIFDVLAKIGSYFTLFLL